MTVDIVTGEIVEDAPALTATEARALTDRIRQTLTVAHDLIATAYMGRAWVALGYESWDTYCAGEFAEARMVRLDREQRREIVAELREQGMSAAAVGSALGISDETARTDILAVARSRGTAIDQPVAGRDGKTYPARRSTTTDITEPVKPRASQRRPLPDVAADVTFDLTKLVERLERIVADDRFPQNAEQIAAKNRGDLLRAAEALARVLDRLNRA